MTDLDIDQLATRSMESTDTMISGWHKLAGNCAKTAALDTLDKRTRDIYRHEEAKGLLQAVFCSYPELSTVDLLRVAACISERANA